MIIRAGKLMVILLLAIVMSGCATYTFLKLRGEVKTLETVIGIGGEITNRSPNKQPLIVVLFTELDGEKQIKNFRVIDESEGFYSFMVPIGDYYIVAFEDANNNLKYDDGEYFGHFGSPDVIRISTLKPERNLHFQVASTKGFPEEFQEDVSMVSRVAEIKSIAVGNITTLDDEKFSEKYGKMGFWKPVTFLKEAGLGIYFLEEYDPEKIPILFVHGALGTPRSFKYISENIDQDHFQAWFYHYPSGVPLSKVSNFLNHLIAYLHDKYGFEQLYLTAHSMGGLIVRSFIVQNVYNERNDYIKLFVSMSSSFGGLEIARTGVDRAPVAVPSWHDLVPNSPFIEQIFEQPLHTKLDYYLFFSYKGDCSMFMDNNDGTVTLRSQLDPRAQEDAVKVYGFDEGHTAILSSPVMFEKYNEIITNTAGIQSE